MLNTWKLQPKQIKSMLFILALLLFFCFSTLSLLDWLPVWRIECNIISHVHVTCHTAVTIQQLSAAPAAVVVVVAATADVVVVVVVIAVVVNAMMAKCAEKGSGLWSIWNMHDMITIWTTNDMSKCRAIEANMYSKQTITNEQQQ